MKGDLLGMNSNEDSNLIIHTSSKYTKNVQKAAQSCFKAVIFDLDGTLLNTLEDIADCMNRVLERYSLPKWATEDYKLFIGDGIKTLVERAIPPNYRNSEFIDLLTCEMNEEYSLHWADKTRPFTDIPVLLYKLQQHNIIISVFSNKPHEFVTPTIKRFFPDINFHALYGATSNYPKKPDPTIPLLIAQSTKLSPQEFVYVGDSAIDMQTAKNANMFAVGASWGFRTKEELINAGANQIIDKPLQLLELFHIEL